VRRQGVDAISEGYGALTRRLSLFDSLMVGYGAMTAETGLDALVAPDRPYEPCPAQWLLRGICFWATR
jgi:hypothetical protein